MNYTFNFTVRFEGLLMSSSELLCVVLLANMDDIGMNILSSYFWLASSNLRSDFVTLNFRAFTLVPTLALGATVGLRNFIAWECPRIPPVSILTFRSRIWQTPQWVTMSVTNQYRNLVGVFANLKPGWNICKIWLHPPGNENSMTSICCCAWVHQYTDNHGYTLYIIYPLYTLCYTMLYNVIQCYTLYNIHYTLYNHGYTHYNPVAITLCIIYPLVKWDCKIYWLIGVSSLSLMITWSHFRHTPSVSNAKCHIKLASP